ncbi:MAG: hypothetical protein KAT34_16145 [Candidatus Aminicenantes bacterium]|nr:hypothetical protein [Candidatus Aminicenantes bacterium]
MSLKPNKGKVFQAPYTIGIPMPDAQGRVRIGIACGGCGNEWKDTLIANKETRVDCPECGGVNKFTIDVQTFGIR